MSVILQKTFQFIFRVWFFFYFASNFTDKVFVGSNKQQTYIGWNADLSPIKWHYPNWCLYVQIGLDEIPLPKGQWWDILKSMLIKWLSLGVGYDETTTF